MARIWLTLALVGTSQRLEQVRRFIVLLRGQRIMLDSDLANLYGVETRVLVQAVKRNRKRFPADFAFQLTLEEAQRLRSQTVILDAQVIETPGQSDNTVAPNRRGKYRKYLPLAFTEQGVAMLSSVLRTDRAIEVNVEIMRAFVRLRQLLSEHADLAQKLAELEGKYDAQFRVVFDAIRELMTPATPSAKRIGFKRDEP